MADLQPQLELIRWVKREEGFLYPGVEVASDPGNRGVHMRVGAGHTIRPNTRIASCPISTTVSVLNAMNIAPFSSRGTNFPHVFINNQSFTVVQYFFLMEQYLLGQKSWWAPYISAIPTPDDIDSMLFVDGSDDTRWLAGTNLKSALAKQNEKWKVLYVTALAQLEGLRWPNTENYTWRLFLWAAMMFGSRGFTSQVLSDTLPADQARPAGHNHPRHQELSKLFSDGFPVLCPLLDILNYKPCTQVEWQPRYSYVGLQVLEQYEAGDEICNNYGPRDNESLMLGYGFAIPSNPFDHFSVGLRVPPSTPLAQTRTWYLDKKKDQDFQNYIFNINHPRVKSASCLEASLFSFDLLDSISVLCANDRELQAMFEARKTYLSTILGSKNGDNNRNLLHTFVQLYRECQQRLSLLKILDPKSNGEVASTPQKRYARVYRQSQMEILATAILLCKYTLLRAKTTHSSEEVVQIVTATSAPSQLHETAASNLRNLIQRHHVSLAQSHELFSFADLLQSLPRKESNAVLTILESAQPHIKTDTPSAQLVVLLTVLRASTNASLPPRISAWLEKLDAWYDQSWSTLSTDPDGENKNDGDGDGVRTLLTRVAGSAERLAYGHLSYKAVAVKGLIWAWNVVAEESVQLPNGLVPSQDGDGDGDGNSGSLLLYIPQ